MILRQYGLLIGAGLIAGLSAAAIMGSMAIS